GVKAGTCALRDSRFIRKTAAFRHFASRALRARHCFKMAQPGADCLSCRYIASHELSPACSPPIEHGPVDHSCGAARELWRGAKTAAACAAAQGDGGTARAENHCRSG